VVLVVAYLAAKNLPALLELLLPQKLPFDQGARYALKTLLQYVVVFLGLLIGLPPLGVTWSRMQWLLAALGVGLGFGLQEIFANFVSGLILLFERPIRVGDIITIGDVTGVVSKIHIRAAIITNWDRQDLIVPNKELITSRVLNWTLTNQTNRIVLQVGAAYGSDPDRVRQILEEILRAHPLVLRDPAPLVTLENLGDSALQFTIRAYLPALDKRLQTIHELYTAIHNRFRHEGIEIPYPQRQLHIRSWSSPVQEASS
ncbi:MAG TPA: mechanosensitive ion channel, partial [Thermoguttaceae bacterium]|nr:mechanosensitive ion channel [Thermoguttaceae bacterium]